MSVIGTVQEISNGDEQFPIEPSVEGTRYIQRLIPESRRTGGPVTRRLYARLMIGFGGAWIIGVLLAAFAPVEWKALGLGLIIPGGGFLYGGHPILAAVSLVLVMATLLMLLVLSTETIILPVWMLTAIASSLTVTSQPWKPALWAVPATFAFFVATATVIHQVNVQRWRKRGQQLNEELATVTFPVSTRANPEVTESSISDLEALRYPLDLLLQPIDEFDGFTKMDQFREAAYRYQLFWSQFTLATAQFTRTPAFTGYTSEAQQNAIRKMLEPIVWRYWRWENLWANGEWNPDPMRRMNIFLPGFYGVSLGIYQSVTGDRQFSTPGSLTFRDGPKWAYEYDYCSISDSVRRNVDDSSIVLQPCEPSSIYAICNTFAMNTLLMHNRLNGDQAAGQALARLVETYEAEMVRPDGHFVLGRMSRGPALPSIQSWSEGLISAWINPAMPDLARRTWWLVRRDLSDPHNFHVSGMDKIDPGNYRIGKDTACRIAVATGAREMGDTEMADAFDAYLHENERISTTPGAPPLVEASTMTNLMWSHSRFMRENVLRDMIAFGAPAEWHEGPVLAEAAYPDVMVARAVTDGRALDLVLQPGGSVGRTRLGLGRLAPGQQYKVTGSVDDRVTADSRGEGIIEVDLDSRTEVRVCPSNG